MVQAIQKQIDEQRQARNNAKEEETLNDLRNRISYLRASGASPLELMQAEEELAAAEEGYSDKLVDQSIAKLEDANEKAASQREEQINLLRSQLELWKASDLFKEEVNNIFEQAQKVMQEGGSIYETDFWKLGGFDELNEFERSQKADLLSQLLQKTLPEVEPPEPEVEEYSPLASGSILNPQIRADLDSSRTTIKEDGAIAETSKGIEATREKNNILRIYKESAQQVLDQKNVYSDDLIKHHTYSDYMDYTEKMTQKGYGDEVVSFEEFNSTLKTKERVTKKSNNAIMGRGWDGVGFVQGKEEAGYILVDGQDEYLTRVVGKADHDLASRATQEGIRNHDVFSYEDSLYMLYNNTARKLAPWNDANDGADTFKRMKNALRFKTGGLADCTGPAWLDGTKSRPEYVLNSAQTERFFSLVDVLERFNTDGAGAKSGIGGDNHFEIEINVDKLENDYGVEQLADKIRRMIYDDASYRNVNAVGFIR